MATGLNNSLKPKFGIKTAKHGSDNTNGIQFLTKNKPLRFLED